VVGQHRGCTLLQRGGQAVIPFHTRGILRRGSCTVWGNMYILVQSTKQGSSRARVLDSALVNEWHAVIAKAVIEELGDQRDGL